MKKKKSADSRQHGDDAIDAYLELLPEDGRAALLDLRETIRLTAPDAQEAFVYGVPGFKLGGKSLVCYAGFKNHCGFYPMSAAIRTRFAGELTGFETSKGTIRFLPGKPLPKSLVQKIVQARIMEIGALDP